MSDLKAPGQCTLFFSLIISPEIDSQELKKEFSDWGIWSQASFEYNPSLNYYSKEMGESLERYFLIGETYNRDVLVRAKQWAQDLEERYSIDGARKVNCDPGIICLEQMLLATGKSYAHRIHIESGVFAELCYVFEAGAFKSLQWTYPDYQNQDKLDLFNLLRSRLFHILRD